MARSQREAHLYPALKSHFARQGYQVYAELPAPHGGYVDLLAVAGPPQSGVAGEINPQNTRTIAVEMKLRFSRLALRQASRNRRFVWQSLIAVKAPFKLDRHTRSLLTRRKVGLLVVGDTEEDGVRCLATAQEEAPAFSIKEVFGRHLEGQVAAMHAAATGGVPTSERVSAYRELVPRVRAAILAHGSVAATEQILEDTLGWNHFRARRAGLLWLLRQQFHEVAQDLWSTCDRVRPAIHAVQGESVVRAQDRSLRVILDPSTPVAAAPGDVLWFVENGRIKARAMLKFAGRYPVKETPQRELRAGPAVFFPWRLAGARPQEVVVAGITDYREVRCTKRVATQAGSPWQTLRSRTG